MKLPKTLEKIVVGASILSGLSFGGCGEDNPYVPPVYEDNDTPNTYIDNHTIYGPNQLNQFRINVTGHGTDVDGTVEGFKYKLNDNSWNYTGTNDETFSKDFDGLTPGSYVFQLKAKDDDSDYDYSPASLNFTLEGEESGNVETQITNVYGQVEFSDGKKITVNDFDYWIGVQGTTVSYLSTPEYKVIETHDEDYHPAFLVTNSSNRENIRIKQTQIHDYDLRFLSEQGKILYHKYVKNSIEENVNSECSIYKETISGEEALFGLHIFQGLLSFVGLDWVVTLTGYISELSGETGNQSFENYILNNNWDEYIIENPTGSGYPNTSVSHFRLTSNQPTLTLENLIVENNNVTVGFTGEDRETYLTLNPGELIDDKTVSCRGPTSSGDLWYEYDLFNSSGDNIVSGGGPIDFYKEKSINNLDSGSYTLELKLLDDTKWKDEYYDSALNKDELEIPFTVEGGEGITILETYDYPNNTYVMDFTCVNGELWSLSCSDNGTSNINRHRDSDLLIIDSYTAPNHSQGITFNGNNFFVTTPFRSDIYKMSNPPTTILEQYSTNENIQDLTFDGNSIFGAKADNTFDRDLVKFDNNFNIIETYNNQYGFFNMAGLTYDGNNFWDIHSENETLNKIYLTENQIIYSNTYNISNNLPNATSITYNNGEFFIYYIEDNWDNKIAKITIE